MTPTIWYRNGEWLKGEPYLSADDAGFVYGAVVTDRIRTFRHVPFQAREHIVRFRMSCEMACVAMPHSNDELSEVVNQVIKKNKTTFDGGNDFVVVLLATPGPMTGNGPPTLIAHTLPLDYARYRPMFERGAHLMIANTTRQIPESAICPGIKHRSRLNWWLARQEVNQVDPGADALLLDDQGFITETASANVVVIKDREVLTPPFASIVLGISLQNIHSMCRVNGIQFREKSLRPEDCYAADEILLTSTSWCMAGVSQLNGRPIPWPGPVYQQLAKIWNEHLGLDYIEQILKEKT